jgi:hypothetical protein
MQFDVALRRAEKNLKWPCDVITQLGVARKTIDR